MYKFRFSEDTSNSFGPGLTLVLFLGTTLGCIIVYSLIQIAVLGNPQSFESYCADTIRCLALQGFSMIMVFILPVFILLKVILKKSFEYLNSDTAQLNRQLLVLFLGVLLMIVAYPLVLETANLTTSFLTSDGYIQWEKSVFNGGIAGMAQNLLDAEESYNAIVQTFLNVEGVFGMVLLFIVVAILPGIAEELVFRGFLQNILMKIIKNPHISIWLAAFIFSLIHGSLLNLIPRMLMGAVLGYVYYYSQNIWIPIIVHAVNNAASIIYMKMLEAEIVTTNIEEMEHLPLMVVIASAVFAPILLWQFKRFAKESLIPKDTEQF